MVDQKFHVDDENTMESILGLCAPLANGQNSAMTQPKSQISNIEHDGTLSIRNLMLIRTQ
jgi:hypothetical protein